MTNLAPLKERVGLTGVTYEGLKSDALRAGLTRVDSEMFATLGMQPANGPEPTRFRELWNLVVDGLCV